MHTSINVIGFAITIVAVLATYRQIKLSTNIAKASFIKEIMDYFVTNEKIKKMIFLIDYGEFEYVQEEFHFNYEEENKIDSLLSLFDTIGALVKLNVVSLSDLEVLHYQIKRTYSNGEIQRYLEFLDSWYADRKIQRRPYGNFRWMAEEISK